MTLCIPVSDDRGSASPVSPHFGSAPYFILVDSETGACRAVPNRNSHHEHGRCAPIAALAGEPVEGVIVGGIGAGALSKLGAAGIRVFLTGHPTVGESVDAFKKGTLQAMTHDMACAHHGGGIR